jgi:hypothetical protein
MIELLHSAEVIDGLLHDPDLQGEDLVAPLASARARASASSRRRAARSSITIGSTTTTW